MRKLNE
ncbi:unnamed protein product, partial [Rotaria sordida]